MTPAVLFDLDGCLADSRRTILDGINVALESLGMPRRPDAELQALIGPPTRVAFAQLLGEAPDSPLVERAVGSYRERYKDDLRATRAFAGVAETLDALRADGIRLAVATSKPLFFARPVLDAIGLADRFDVVAGPELTGTAGKAETMQEAIDGLGAGTVPVAHVGDRAHDVEGALAHGLLAVGVLWGMGDRAELEAAGADVLVDEPAQLVPLLRDAATRARRASSTEQTGP